MPWKGISAPFKHAKSSRDLRLSMGLLVLALQAKRSKLRQQKNVAPTSFTFNEGHKI
jgi:hypothetical protein